MKSHSGKLLSLLSFLAVVSGSSLIYRLNSSDMGNYRMLLFRNADGKDRYLCYVHV